MFDTHPSITEKLQWFEYDHLPQHLRTASRPFHTLAHQIVDDLGLEGPQVALGLQRLIEAKDCIVRAAHQSSPKSDVG